MSVTEGVDVQDVDVCGGEEDVLDKLRESEMSQTQ